MALGEMQHFMSAQISNMSLNTAHPDQYKENTAHPDQHKEENGVRGEEDENRNLCSRKNDQSREK